MSGTKNKLVDLNDHLFAQIKRLSDDSLVGEKLQGEIQRGNAIVALAEQVIDNAGVQLNVAKFIKEHGPANADPMSHLPQIEGRPRQIGNGADKSRQ